MSWEEWESLAKENPEDYQRAYADFMFRGGNAQDCANCPYGGWGMSPRPCGQQTCWVEAHCAALVDDEEEAEYEN